MAGKWRSKLPKSYKAQFFHVRFARTFKLVVRKPMRRTSVCRPVQAVTLAILRTDKAGRHSYFVAASACSAKDRFSKRIGRDIALGRALKELAAGAAHRQSSAPVPLQRIAARALRKFKPAMRSRDLNRLYGRGADAEEKAGLRSDRASRRQRTSKRPTFG